jgi:2-C-methyl-D-erythritol 4-phosphate cytidylyltransferase
MLLIKEMHEHSLQSEISREAVQEIYLFFQESTYVRMKRIYRCILKAKISNDANICNGSKRVTEKHSNFNGLSSTATFVPFVLTDIYS